MAVEEIADLAARPILGGEVQRDVGPVEGMDEDPRLGRKQFAGDVGAGHGIGGGGQRDHLDGQAGLAEGGAHAGELAIFGTEVVAPLRDAVRLVDRQPADAGDRQKRGQAGADQPLGRDEEQAQRAGLQPGEGLAVLFLAVHGIERGGGNADPLHLRHLVAHQGDQRRDDDRQSAIEKRRQLVAHGLAAAGRHDGEHVGAGQDRGDDLVLAGTEIVIAESGLHCRAGAGKVIGHDAVCPRNAVRFVRLS